jgi:hypothetical protein
MVKSTRENTRMTLEMDSVFKQGNAVQADMKEIGLMTRRRVMVSTMKIFLSTMKGIGLMTRRRVMVSFILTVTGMKGIG